MRKECTCGGNNENCYKCFGIGYYNAIEEKPPKSIKNKYKYKKNKNVKQKSKKNSDTNIKASDINKKIANLNKRLSSQKSLNSKKNTANKVTRTECPHCKLLVKMENLEEHIRKHHKQIQNISNKKANSKKDIEVIKCPHCESFVRSDRLKRHIKKVHIKGYEKEVPPTSRISKNSFNNSPRLTHSTASKLDASREWSSFREGGRFGSHPSFDSMDDESKP